MSAQRLGLATLAALLLCIWQDSAEAQYKTSEPPPKFALERDLDIAAETPIDEAMGSIGAFLEENFGSEGVQAVIVSDDNGRLFTFAPDRVVASSSDFELHVGNILVPVDLGGGRGGITAAFDSYGYIYTGSVWAGACNLPNEGGKRPCN